MFRARLLFSVNCRFFRMDVRKYGMKREGGGEGEKMRENERKEYTCLHDARRGRNVCDGKL